MKTKVVNQSDFGLDPALNLIPQYKLITPIKLSKMRHGRFSRLFFASFGHINFPAKRAVIFPIIALKKTYNAGSFSIIEIMRRVMIEGWPDSNPSPYI